VKVLEREDVIKQPMKYYYAIQESPKDTTVPGMGGLVYFGVGRVIDETDHG